MSIKDPLYYECVVIGGGPAGISAAIYLARFNREVVVIDTERDGRWNTHEINENYLGFPDGIAAIELRERGKRQAQKFGAKFATDEIVTIQKIDDDFKVIGTNDVYMARSVIFATGVHDNYPEFEAMQDCLGRSLFWCITCDGYKTKDKKVLLVGQTEGAISTCLQFLNYTNELVFVTNANPGETELTEELIEKLIRNGIAFYEGKITGVKSTNGLMETVMLSTGDEIQTTVMFNLKEATPNTDLARSLGVEVNKYGYILATNEQRTNVARVYAAGDVTKSFAHQIVTAAHEGSMAAQSLNYDLYDPLQR